MKLDLFRIAASLVLVNIILSNTAHSAVITFQLEGEIVSVAPELSHLFQTSQPLLAIYAFESTTPDTRLIGDFGFYHGALTSGSMMLGSYLATLNPGGIVNSIIVGDNFPTLNWQSYSVEGSFVGSSIGGFIPQNAVIITLRDETATAFDDIDLPLLPPDLGAFEPQFWHTALGFHEISSGVNAEVLAKVTSFVLVPEPLTLSFLALGGLVLRRRRRI